MKNIFWQNEITEINSIGNGVNFWEKWKRMGENLVHGNNFSYSFDGQKWENHFKMLFKIIGDDINNTMKKSDTLINKTLNEKFTMGELKQRIKGLKNKKDVCPDSIANEFLKSINKVKHYIPVLSISKKTGEQRYKR